MKSCDEMVDSLLERRDRYVAEQKKRNSKTKKIVTVLCVVLSLGAVIVPAIAADELGILFLSDRIAERQDVAATEIVSLSEGKTIEVKYDKSRYVSGIFADIYKDEKKNDFIYKNRKLVGFYSNEIDRPATDCPPIGKDAAVKIAVSFLSAFTDNAEEYTLQMFNEKENYGQYYITFAKKIGNIFTSERADISVMYDGGVKSVLMQDAGKFDDTPDKIVEGITEFDVLSYAKAEMEIIYPGRGESFEIISYCLERDDNGYYILICGNVGETDIGDNFEYVRYDLEN